MNRIIHFTVLSGILMIILLLYRGVWVKESLIPDSRILNADFRPLNPENSTEFFGGTKAMIDKGQIDSFLRSAQNELEQDILPFWIRYCLDDEYGGFIGRMSNDRTIVKDAPKGLVLNARIL